jgi:phosphonoacetate hydrolase
MVPRLCGSAILTASPPSTSFFTRKYEVTTERAAGAALPEYGVDDVKSVVGFPAPGIYDWDASHYAMRIGLGVYRRRRDLRLLYVSFTDRVQHAVAPLADKFFTEFDSLLGEYLDEGFLVGITADHGMNGKHLVDGSPAVHYLADVLEEAGVVVDDVVLPITDPYTKHHGALGSFAWPYLAEDQRGRAREVLAALPGIEEVWDRATPRPSTSTRSTGSATSPCRRRLTWHWAAGQVITTCPACMAPFARTADVTSSRYR